MWMKEKRIPDNSKNGKNKEVNQAKKCKAHAVQCAMMAVTLAMAGCTNLPNRNQTNNSNEVIYLDEITVEIQGEVNVPGTYSLPKKAALMELIALAQGLTTNADASGLNMNQKLSHHDVIIIDEKKEIEKISINMASLEQLQQLPGIGPKTAEAIIQYREINGLFQTIDELNHVKGIGIKKLERMREFIKL